MIIAKERVSASHTGIALEYTMSAQASNDGGLRELRPGQRGLATNAEEVRNEIPIDEERSVSEEAGQFVVHIESCVISRSAMSRIPRAGEQRQTFLDGVDNLGRSGDALMRKVLEDEGLREVNGVG